MCTERAGSGVRLCRSACEGERPGEHTHTQTHGLSRTYNTHTHMVSVVLTTHARTGTHTINRPLCENKQPCLVVLVCGPLWSAQPVYSTHTHTYIYTSMCPRKSTPFPTEVGQGGSGWVREGQGGSGRVREGQGGSGWVRVGQAGGPGSSSWG